MHGPYVPEHRILLWNRIGPGVHQCYWCGREVAWCPGGHTRAGVLIVDHVDRNELNNSPENIQPSCQTCNIYNSDRTVRDDELFIVRKNGTRLRAVEKTCGYCEAKFLAAKGLKPGQGLYCSRSCGVKAQHRAARTL